MATIDGICANCGVSVQKIVGENLDDGHLNWYASYICPSCGANIIEDGWDDIPPDIRQSILLADGIWRLGLPENSRRQVHALRILRQALKLTVKEAGELLQRDSQAVSEGTRMEMERLRLLLLDEGIESTVEPAIRS